VVGIDTHATPLCWAADGALSGLADFSTGHGTDSGSDFRLLTARLRRTFAANNRTGQLKSGRRFIPAAFSAARLRRSTAPLRRAGSAPAAPWRSRRHSRVLPRRPRRLAPGRARPAAPNDTRRPPPQVPAGAAPVAPARRPGAAGWPA